MFKEFGIYTKHDSSISILVEVTKYQLIGIQFPMNKFEILSNQEINKKLLNDKNFQSAFLFSVDLVSCPNAFLDYGYLGEVESKLIKEKLKKKIESIKEQMFSI